MMQRKRLFLVLLGCLMILPGSLWAAQDEIGEIAYIEGTVEIIRNAKVMGRGEVDFGTIIQNMDQIRVGKNGIVEITIDEKTGVGSTLRLSPGTVLTLDVTGMQSSQTGDLDLLAGTVALKVKKLGASSRLNIRTGNAAMGVRGTEFQVTMAISGEVLLSTSEGDVECSSDQGFVAHSVPGVVIESTMEGDWKSQDVKISDLKSFRENWEIKKIDAFRADPGRATVFYAKRYKRLKADFDRAYDTLMRQRDLVEKWIREDRSGTMAEMAMRMMEKKRILPGLNRMKVSMVMLERVFLRLGNLEELYRQGIAASGQIEKGQSVASFFRSFAAERSSLEQRLAEANYIIKLYSRRNDGKFPLGMVIDDQAEEDLFSDEDF